MFSTYAVPMILGEIKRYIRDDGKLKVSRQMKTDIRNLKRIKEEYYYKNGTWPKLSYLPGKWRVPVEKVLEILDAAEALSNVESLDNSEISEGYREKKVSHISEEDRNIELIDLKMVIGSLSERERQVIVLRYFKDMTQQQIAGKMGISRCRYPHREKSTQKYAGEDGGIKGKNCLSRSCDKCPEGYGNCMRIPYPSVLPVKTDYYRKAALQT